MYLVKFQQLAYTRRVPRGFVENYQIDNEIAKTLANGCAMADGGTVPQSDGREIYDIGINIAIKIIPLELSETI